MNVYRALAFNEEMERQMEGRCAVLAMFLNIYLHSDCELWCTCTLLKVSKIYIRQSAVSHALIPCQPEPSDFSNWALLHPLAPLRPFCVLLWPRDFLFFFSHVIELVRFQTRIKSSGWPFHLIFLPFNFTVFISLVPLLEESRRLATWPVRNQWEPLIGPTMHTHS